MGQACGGRGSRRVAEGDVLVEVVGAAEEGAGVVEDAAVDAVPVGRGLGQGVRLGQGWALALAEEGEQGVLEADDGAGHLGEGGDDGVVPADENIGGGGGGVDDALGVHVEAVVAHAPALSRPFIFF